LPAGCPVGSTIPTAARIAARLQQMDRNMSPETKRRLELYLPSTDFFSDDTLGDPGVRVIQAFVEERTEERTEYDLTNRFKK
jgi:hypothetical protein